MLMGVVPADRGRSLANEEIADMVASEVLRSESGADEVLSDARVHDQAK